MSDENPVRQPIAGGTSFNENLAWRSISNSAPFSLIWKAEPKPVYGHLLQAAGSVIVRIGEWVQRAGAVTTEPTRLECSSDGVFTMSGPNQVIDDLGEYDSYG